MKRTTLLACLLPLPLILAACSGTQDSPQPGPQDATSQGPAELSEVSSLHPRLTYTHEGGITTIDAITGDTLATTEREGFLRLNPSGDGRSLFVSAGDEFLLYDTAAQRIDHGDHYHYYAGTPVLTSTTFPAPHAGHVVTHQGRTALFSDEEGTATLLPTDSLLSEDGPQPTEYASGAGHHGVAVPLAEGLLSTAGTTEERHTIRLIDAAGDATITETTDCPGVHGEAVAEGERVVFGCENGPVVFDGSDFQKVPVDEPYQRSGNLAGSPDSPYVLGDYKIDPEAEHEHPTAVAIIDSHDATLRTVDLGSTYWFRSLGRDEEGHGVVLTADGSLRLLDLESGEELRRIPVIEPWEEKEDWQEPGPILQVAGSTAYVSDATGRLFLVDLRTGEVVAQHDLAHTPVEMSVTGV
ncbi:PQQ-binding-like beta-propeller repeat protein [Corynebacterium lowii]|uniref:Secreted protein n=1 Tax=Corynebacterium lowii TaxID=1544413 RepID=A0A0N8W084_9CORY|nr:PQQ-binding-like beta-propeller repeat protein [Corynebacterium lowii]KQB85986.1 hypothetical protein Clow_01728 [Corynebacterium lowii]MDP9850584.1 hypothetical protein [Corynebacterium lowii]